MGWPAEETVVRSASGPVYQAIEHADQGLPECWKRRLPLKDLFLRNTRMTGNDRYAVRN